MRIAATIFSILLVLALGLAALLLHPNTPLPEHHNPFKPLRLTAPLSPITPWKLERAASDLPTCLALIGESSFQRMEDYLFNDQCHIKGRIKLAGVGGTRMRPFETRCETALRLAMWEHHSLQPAALRHLNTSVAQIAHFGSYSCRRIRTPQGSLGQMSTHATADAVDVSGFQLADGRVLSLRDDWNGDAPTAAFLREVQESSCSFFDTSLGPEYNALHADHFHLQSSGWGTCR